ncbi:hypothetical protein [Ruminococcus flavefaciens]|uniref:hypothetical protein n=1 Tax=Ruminococcus flavefaciens TaxID=1265 RepID=UPI00031CE29A|nr:hypothetical protein [Ruminococcus flavefaciens]
MSRDEMLVIAAAAAVFVIINIIMWSIIARKERKAKGNAAPQINSAAESISSVSAAAAAEGFALMENTVIIHTSDRIV